MKVQEYDLKRLGQQMVDFHDDLRDLIGNGKYAHPIVSSVPAWTADNGEMAFYDGASSGGLSGRRIYVRLSSAWHVFATAPFAGNPAPPEGAVQFYAAGSFGGMPSFVFNNTQSSLQIISTNNGVNLYLNRSGATTQSSPFIHVDDPVSVGTCFFLTTGANLGVGYNPVFGAGAQGVLSIGQAANPPKNATDSVQLNCANPPPIVGGLFAGLSIVPELQGPHHIGKAVIFSTPQVFIMDDITDPVLDIRGVQGANLNFSTRDLADVFNVFLDMTSSGTPRVGPGLKLSNDTDTKAFLAVLPEPETGLKDEQLSFIISGQGTATNQRLGRDLQWNSGNNIIDQRSVYLVGPRLDGTVAAGGGAVTTISNAATLFIEGPPTILTSGSITVVNSYALWVGTGDVRIGGNVITGGNTTPTKSGVIFTTTAIGVSSNNSSDTTLIRGVIGTTSLVANTLSEGRTIRLQARGYYNTAASAPSLRWNVKLGGTTVLTTGSLQTMASVSTGMFDLTGLITCWTTGGAGTVYAQGDVSMGTGALDSRQWGMVNSGTIVLNTTGANVVEVTVQWGSGAPQNEVAMTHCVGELLN